MDDRQTCTVPGCDQPRKLSCGLCLKHFAESRWDPALKKHMLPAPASAATPARIETPLGVVPAGQSEDREAKTEGRRPQTEKGPVMPKTKGMCLVDGCTRPVKNRGVCGPHYQAQLVRPDSEGGRAAAAVILPSRTGPKAKAGNRDRAERQAAQAQADQREAEAEADQRAAGADQRAAEVEKQAAEA